ncbi:MAG: ComF family protein [Bacteroidetes bacterium]|nr:ComF family protein [Bacteroidota bacterium]
MPSAAIKQYTQGFVSLFYPSLCAACNAALVKNERSICTACHLTLPRSGDELFPNENPVAKVFWGRLKLEAAVSCYLFSQGGNVQELIHRLKYNGRRDAGIVSGRIFGNELKELTPFNNASLVIPVPLHYKKLRKRGYNQAACFGEGLAEGLEIPMKENILLRLDATDTQTRKSREARWKNVEDVFVVREKEKLEGKHLILVDDVITTGATIEACAIPLLKIEGVKLSVVSLASARD